MGIETGYFSLKLVTDCHWNMQQIVTKAGYEWPLKQYSASYWKQFMMFIEKVIIGQWNRFRLLL
jgi:hypothetical protein